MIAISLTFPAGRYHATPWGRHVNEGAVEWPPSPWRLLRSLVAVWKRTLPDVTEAEIKPVFEALTATPPLFVLPPASTGHTRHYMPWYKKGPTDRTLVFDAFVALDPSESAVHAIWPDAKLDNAKRHLLTRLLANLNFLGRAESWCEACLLDGKEEQVAYAASNEASRRSVSIGPDEPKSRPATLEERNRGELVRTLCADPATAFDDTHIVDITVTTQGRGKSKTTTETRRPVYEPNWHLCMETLRLHDQKWSDPPGSRWVTYTRPRNCFEIANTTLARRRRQPRRLADVPSDLQSGGLSFAAFRLRPPDGDTERFTTFPQYGAVHVAAMLRSAACRLAKEDLECSRPHLAESEWRSREEWGRRVVAGHGENEADKRRSKGDDSPRLSYLPLPSFVTRGRGKTDIVGAIRRVVVAEFTGQDTVDSIAWVRQRLNGELLIDERTGEAVAMLSPLSEGDYVLQQYTGGHGGGEGSRVWASVTPVILPGYDDGKRAKRDRLLHACLKQAGLPTPEEPIESRLLSWFPGVAPNSQFNDLNIRGLFKRRPDYLRHLPAVHVRLRFREPIWGPLSLGAGRHSGLGILAAAAE